MIVSIFFGLDNNFDMIKIYVYLELLFTMSLWTELSDHIPTVVSVNKKV